MDREKVLRLAESAGMLPIKSRVLAAEWWSVAPEDLERFAAAVAAAVKEEDARICIDYANRLAGISHHDHPPADEAAVDCADEIRASIKEVK